MPLVFFVSPTDPRMLATLDAINRSPAEGGLVSDSLVYRYDAAARAGRDPGRRGHLQHLHVLAGRGAGRRAAGTTHGPRLRDARLIFERMLGYANHLGLYSEETGPTGEPLGNFPQAFTHLALISAAFNLDRALGGPQSSR